MEGYKLADMRLKEIKPDEMISLIGGEPATLAVGTFLGVVAVASFIGGVLQVGL